MPDDGLPAGCTQAHIDAQAISKEEELIRENITRKQIADEYRSFINEADDEEVYARVDGRTEDMLEDRIVARRMAR